MQTIIKNAKIYLEQDKFAQAMLIEQDLISKVGTNAEIEAAATSDTTVFDAQGKTIIPGFNDSHMHLYSVGNSLASVILYGASTIDEVIARGRAFIETNKPATGTVITGRGWNQDYFTDENRLLTREDLDKISTEYPIIFNRACGHIVVCNSKTLELAGIDANTKQVAGGEFYFDANKQPNGLFSENATALVTKIIPPATENDIAQMLKTAMAYATSHGITSIHTNDVNENNYNTMLSAYKAVYDSEAATLRTYHQCCFSKPDTYAQFLDAGHKTGVGSKYNQIGSLKLFVDGSLGARTALMRSPYADDASTTGICCMPQDTLNSLIKLANDNQSQVAVHAIGDKAIEMVLDGYDTVIEAGTNTNRHGIVHCQITDTPLIERFYKNSILAYVQPIFLHYDMHIVASRVGETLAKTSYNFGTMYRMGIHTSFGTDSPVEDLGTMDNIYCAVARKDLKSNPVDGYYPNEGVTISQAIDQYTLNGAYASFEEKVKGRLLPGYYADLAVLNDDIFTVDLEKIRGIKVDMTMMGGKIVFQR